MCHFFLYFYFCLVCDVRAKPNVYIHYLSLLPLAYTHSASTKWHIQEREKRAVKKWKCFELIKFQQRQQQQQWKARKCIKSNLEGEQEKCKWTDTATQRGKSTHKLLKTQLYTLVCLVNDVIFEYAVTSINLVIAKDRRHVCSFCITSIVARSLPDGNLTRKIENSRAQHTYTPHYHSISIKYANRFFSHWSYSTVMAWRICVCKHDEKPQRDSLSYQKKDGIYNMINRMLHPQHYSFQLIKIAKTTQMAKVKWIMSINSSAFFTRK